jgi:hypothetical protein
MAFVFPDAPLPRHPRPPSSPAVSAVISRNCSGSSTTRVPTAAHGLPQPARSIDAPHPAARRATHEAAANSNSRLPRSILAALERSHRTCCGFAGAG